MVVFKNQTPHILNWSGVLRCKPVPLAYGIEIRMNNNMENTMEEILNNYVNGNLSDFKKQINSLIRKELMDFLNFVYENHNDLFSDVIGRINKIFIDLRKEKTIPLFRYEELNEKAKGMAKDQLNGFDGWWTGIYEDAEILGMKIRAFDIDNQMIKIEIDGLFDLAKKIIDNCGKDSKIYKIASKFIESISSKFIESGQGEDDIDLFIDSIENYYFEALKEEYSYINSEEYISELCEYNEYYFDEKGNFQTLN